MVLCSREQELSYLYIPIYILYMYIDLCFFVCVKHLAPQILQNSPIHKSIVLIQAPGLFQICISTQSQVQSLCMLAPQPLQGDSRSWDHFHMVTEF